MVGEPDWDETENECRIIPVPEIVVENEQNHEGDDGDEDGSFHII